MSPRGPGIQFDARYQITIMLAANLLAFALSGVSITYFVVSVVSFAVLLFGFDKTISLLKQSSDVSRREIRRIKRKITGLSMDEARRNEEKVISQPGKFAVVTSASKTVPELPALGVSAPELIDFFSKYKKTAFEMQTAQCVLVGCRI